MAAVTHPSHFFRPIPRPTGGTVPTLEQYTDVIDQFNELLIQYGELDRLITAKQARYRELKSALRDWQEYVQRKRLVTAGGQRHDAAEPLRRSIAGVPPVRGDESIRRSHVSERAAATTQPPSTSSRPIPIGHERSRQPVVVETSTRGTHVSNRTASSTQPPATSSRPMPTGHERPRPPVAVEGSARRTHVSEHTAPPTQSPATSTRPRSTEHEAPRLKRREFRLNPVCIHCEMQFDKDDNPTGGCRYHPGKSSFLSSLPSIC